MFIIYDHLANIVKIYHECELGRAYPSRGSPFGITRLAEWWQTVLPRDIFLHPTITQIVDSFPCSTLIVNFKISFQKSQYTPRCIISRWRHFDITMTSLDDHVREFLYIYTTNVHPSCDSLDKITWVRYEFLTQNKISDILIRCARNILNKSENATPKLCAIHIQNDGSQKIKWKYIWMFKAWVMQNSIFYGCCHEETHESHVNVTGVQFFRLKIWTEISHS